MKKIFIIFLMLSFMQAAFCALPSRKYSNMPEGTFKKSRNGKIVQYDKAGKKIGTYKLDSGKYIKIK